MQECDKGNIKVVGVYFPNIKEPIKEIDGYKVLSDTEFLQFDADYYVVFSETLIQLVKHLACNIKGKNSNCVLSSRIFSIFRFDFQKYINLYNSKISILANTCFGGLMYHRLGMEFTSPFINMWIAPSDFLKIVSDLDYYLSMDLVYVRNGWEQNLNREYPIMALGDVELLFNHYESVEQALTIWNRRLKRLNKNNIFVECRLTTEKEAETFFSIAI